jgi:hypothetical protein
MEPHRAQAARLHHDEWRAKPLVSYLAIIQLIASTTTETEPPQVCRRLFGLN